MGNWLNNLNRTTLADNQDGLITLMIIMFGGLAICIFLFIIFRKCLLFGKSINYNVLSLNIILFALPPLVVLALEVLGLHAQIPWIPVIIGWIVLWVIPLVRNIIKCGKHVGYTVAYTICQLILAALLASIVITIVGVAIGIVLVVVALFIGGSTTSEAFNIKLAPVGAYSYSEIIRARKKDNDGEILSGINGEVFRHLHGNNYILISSISGDNDNQVYRIIN